MTATRVAAASPDSTGYCRLATVRRVSDEPAPFAAEWLRAARDLLHERVPDNPSLASWHLQWAGTRRTSHAFRHEYGITVAEYSRSLRLEWALAQIALGDAPLARVAIDAGFSDQSHFTRAFRRHVGVTPGRYRKQTRR